MESMADWIESRLGEGLAPARVTVTDESHRHAGHAGATQGGHFDVTVVSPAFRGLSRLERHRRVHELVGDRIGAGIHALSLRFWKQTAAARW